MSVDTINKNEGKACPTCKKGILRFEGCRVWDKTSMTSKWERTILVCDNCGSKHHLLVLDESVRAAA